MERDPGADQRHLVVGGAAHDARPADWEALAGRVDDRVSRGSCAGRRRLERSTIWATRAADWLASDGYRTVLPCTARIMARSRAHLGWAVLPRTPGVGPDQGQVGPAHAAIRMKSLGPGQEGGEGRPKGTPAATCIPTAAPTICCSAMYISSSGGCAWRKISAYVELPHLAVEGDDLARRSRSRPGPRRTRGGWLAGSRIVGG